jgi:hypothetical protein
MLLSAGQRDQGTGHSAAHLGRGADAGLRSDGGGYAGGRRKPRRAIACRPRDGRLGACVEKFSFVLRGVERQQHSLGCASNVNYTTFASPMVGGVYLCR